MQERKPNRLSGFDYSQGGYYFVTICVKDRVHLFGEIIDGEMILSETGQIVQNELLKIPQTFRNALVDYWVVMPNHIHAIINIRRGLIHQTPMNDADMHDGGMINHAPTVVKPWQLMKRSDVPLGKIVRHYKAKTTKLIHDKNITFSWQRNFHDHIIRTEKSLNKTRQYILSNPILNSI